MNKSDIALIRKKLLTKKRSIDCVCGCYVSADKHVVATFRHSLGSLPENEAAQYVFLFRKILTGEMGKTLKEAEFSPTQVMNGAEHALLMEMRKSRLSNPDTLSMFYENVIAGIKEESNFLILLMHYMDFSFGAQDKEIRSNKELDFILCCVCPVKMTPGQLCFHPEDGEFHLADASWAALLPKVGFCFPAVENGADNLYKALYYTRDTGDNHTDFADAVFRVPLAMPAKEQRQELSRVLEETLGKECSLDAMESVQEKAIERIQEMKIDKEAPTPVLSTQDVQDALENAGVSEEKISAFAQKYDETFGNAQLPAVNCAPAKLEVKLPDIVIKVKPEKSHLITTRREGDLTYLMIRADSDVEVNGVRVHMITES